MAVRRVRAMRVRADVVEGPFDVDPFELLLQGLGPSRGVRQVVMQELTFVGVVLEPLPYGGDDAGKRLAVSGLVIGAGVRDHRVHRVEHTAQRGFEQLLFPREVVVDGRRCDAGFGRHPLDSGIGEPLLREDTNGGGHDGVTA